MVANERAIAHLLAAGVEPLRIVRVSVDGWRANRLGALYDYVTRVATTSLGHGARRYWFVDEVTATEGPWWSAVKDLRDNTGLRDDCVVLTGSSNRGLDDAVKALAGRRGGAVSPDRALLPMGFRAFCTALGLASPGAPALRPDALRTSEARAAWLDLTPWTDDLVAAWQAYLEVGGYPRAVGDWRRGNAVGAATWASLWDVVRGEAVTAGVGEATVAALVDGLAHRLASTVAVGPFAESAGVHRSVLEARLERWPERSWSGRARPRTRQAARRRAASASCTSWTRWWPASPSWRTVALRST